MYLSRYIIKFNNFLLSDNLRVCNGRIEAILNFSDAFTIALNAIEKRLYEGVDEYNFIAERCNHPARLQSTDPQINSHGLSQKLVTKSEPIWKSKF